ncbi:hypothetical protein HWV62_39700, partial [Athelia sp. TMB]
LFSDPYDKLVDALLNNLPLLEDLTIHGAITSLSHLLQFSPSKVSLPALIRLRLLAYDEASKPQLHFLDAISAPLLESVVLEDVCYPAVQFLVTTFPQVHTLSIAPGKDVGQDPRALIGRLGSLFPHVRHLAVKALEVAWLPRDYLPPLAHMCPNMESLTVHELPRHEVVQFCDSLLQRTKNCPLPGRLFLRNCELAVIDAVSARVLDCGMDIKVLSSTGDNLPWYANTDTPVKYDI